jgi:K+-sensing histidine kinase KdpD
MRANTWRRFWNRLVSTNPGQPDTAVRERVLRRTQELYQTSRRIGALSSPQEVLGTLLESASLSDASLASVYLFEQPWESQHPTSGVLSMVGRQGSTASQPESRVVAFDEYWFASLCSRDAYRIAADLSQEQALPPQLRRDLLAGGLQAFALFPLIAAGQWIGMLAFYWQASKDFHPEYIRHLQGMIDPVAGALYASRLLVSEAQARREAEKANEVKLKFLAMISHELRTPLTSIQGFADTLLADDVRWEPEQQQEFLEIISHEADKLSELIGHLLDLTRLEAGVLSFHPQTLPLAQILEESLPQIAVLTTEHELKLDIPDDLPLVFADRDRIAQVLTNLVANAGKYAPPGTVILIAARPDSHQVQVSVEDEGPGIAPEMREAVFMAFQRAGDPQEGMQSPGAGLGLAISKAVIQAHNGRIWVDDAPARGAKVCFTLPQSEEGVIP